jgi:mycofactocin precursor peptide peptidase
VSAFATSSALGDLTWPQAETRAPGALLAVPVGATEQHGPHLPLSTDTDIAVALADALARDWPGAVAAPAIAYGSSGEHKGFPGTISVGRKALELVLVELGRSATATFERLVFVSTHGGNADVVTRAVRRLRAESRAVLAWSPSWSGDAHAGRVETSIMLALDPGRVDLSRAESGNIAPLTELLPALRTGGIQAVSANGVLGDPTGASAEEGIQLLASATADLVSTAKRA